MLLLVQSSQSLDEVGAMFVPFSRQETQASENGNGSSKGSSWQAVEMGVWA